MHCLAKFQCKVHLSLVVEVLKVAFSFTKSNFGPKSQFIVHVESLVVHSPLCCTLDVLIGSFSDMIFLLRAYFIFVFMSKFYIFCIDVCYVVDMRHLSLTCHDYSSLTFHGGY